MRVWRLCKERYASTAFTGEGARLFSGRWNFAGVPMVYTSTSRALAVLEIFVHMPKVVAPDDFVFVGATLRVDTSQAERIHPADLPPDWHRTNHPVLQGLGSEWAGSGRSLVLMVPSVIIEGEWNALINPAHPDAASITLEEPTAFHFDHRLFQP